MRRLVYLLVEMPDDLAVSGDMLGSRWELTGSPIAATVVFPRLPSDPTIFGDLEPPDLLAGSTPVANAWQEWRSFVDASRHLWGTPMETMPPDHHVIAAAVIHSAAIVEYDGDHSAEARWEFVEAAHSGVRTWLDFVRDWLEVMTGGLIRRDPPGEVSPTNAERLSIVLDPATGRAERFAEARQLVGPTWRQPAPVTREQWSAAVRYVGAGARPANAHLLIRDARRAYRAGDWKRAAIDSSTACEVGLAESIRELIGGALPPDAVDELFTRQLKGVVDLFRFRTKLREISGLSQTELDRKIARVRNDVVHQGRVPTDDEARTSIGCATRLVDELNARMPPI